MTKNQLKALAAYKMQKRCDDEGLFVVEGVKLCCEAAASDFEIVATCATREFLSDNSPGDSWGEVFEVSDDQLERLSSLRAPNKVWMLVRRKSPQETQRGEGSRLVLALDGLQDPGNMGTILRTADWFGVRHVVCDNGTVSCYNPKVVQASMGAIFRTATEYCCLADRLQAMTEEGWTVYGAMLSGESLYRMRPEGPAVLVIGNEGHGISPAVAETITRRVTIPNVGGTCESLNASVAAAILISEFYR